MASSAMGSEAGMRECLGGRTTNPRNMNIRIRHSVYVNEGRSVIVVTEGCISGKSRDVEVGRQERNEDNESTV